MGLKNLIFLFVFLFCTSFAAADWQSCDIAKQCLCIEFSDDLPKSRIEEIERVCAQNEGQIQLKRCQREQVVGRCLFQDGVTTFYYTPEYDDYGAEMTCNYSLGKYLRGAGGSGSH